MKHCRLGDIVNSEIAEDTKFWTVVLWILPYMHADLDLLLGSCYLNRYEASKFVP